MTKQYGFVVDVSRCTGCRTCAVACKDAHNLPVGLNLRRVLEEASGSWRQDRMTGAWHQDVRAWYVSIACNHCENPACVKVCPTKAHYKRAEDGLVVIDRDKCIGCGMCAQACPYGAPQLDEKARKMMSRIKPLVDFGKNLRGYVQGIIAAADFKINTSVLEGVNNKIKQIKRRAYGFRDDQYFFLKVKAAFHGLPR